jgi:hypothetical protein
MSYQSIQPFLVDGHASLGPARHLVVANLKSKRIEEILQMALRGRHGAARLKREARPGVLVTQGSGPNIDPPTTEAGPLEPTHP